MADEKLTWPSSTPTAVSDYQAQNNILAKLALGFMELSLTNYNNTSLPAVAAGSIVEVAGSLYTFATETAISGTCTDTSTNYIYLVPSGTSLTPTWTTTAPTWDSAKQGWYGTGGAATYRYIASLYRDGTAYIGKTMLTAPVRPKTGVATLVVAASDSSARSKAMADYTCDGTADNIEIQAAIDYVNGLGFGEVVLMEGIYNIATMITVKDNVNVRGCGATLKRAAAITRVISTSGNDHIRMINLIVDGNKSTYTGTSYAGFYGYGDDVHCTGCRSYNNDDYGFHYCKNLSNCVAYGNTNGFHFCYELSNCESYSNTGNGFESCCRLSSCKGETNTNDGFAACIGLTSCIADSNGDDGFSSCLHLSACEAKSNTDVGFNGCESASSCYSLSNGGEGFRTCAGLVTNYAYNNGTYGFYSCTHMGYNRSSANTTGAYYTCYADTSTTAAADTTAGGYNH